MKRLTSAVLSSLMVGAFLVASGPAPEARASGTGSVFGTIPALDCIAGALGTPSASYALSASNSGTRSFTISESGAGTVCDYNTTGGVLGPSSSRTGTIATGNTVTFTVTGAGTVSVGTGNGTVSIAVIVCALDGVGTSSNPWLVRDQEDFQQVGANEGSGGSFCSPTAHYLQADDLTSAHSSGTPEILDSYTDDQVAEAFSGTYDGDHYSIELGGTGAEGWRYDSNGDSAGGFATRSALFADVNGGTIKRVRISGTIKSDNAIVAGLVEELRGGGVISEVDSAVYIESSDDSPILGGIVGQTANGDARVQYSKATGEISWAGATTTPDDVSIGGIIGQIAGTGVKEVRDSYFTGQILIDSSDFYDDPDTDPAAKTIHLGGIIGDENDINGKFVRTYSVGSASDSCVDPAAPDTPICAENSGVSANLFAGALSGGNGSISSPVFVSNFYLRSGLFQSAVGDGSDPAVYSGSGYPVAVPLSSSRLKQIATYTTLELDSSDLPGGTAMADDASTDFRWAIEGISAQTFVPSNYDAGGTDDDPGEASEIADYTNRVAYSNTDSVTKYYRKLRAGVLDAHNAAERGDIDPAEVLNYPELGRVWDICDDYPSLVWEEVNSCGGGGGDDDDDRSSSPSMADLAFAAGLTEAEYAAFLASGLTLEQFKAARLAATGPNGSLLVGGGALTLLFLAAGAAILVSQRRQRSL